MKKVTIAQGAEAIILKTEDKVTKDRIVKSYRLKELDNNMMSHIYYNQGVLLEIMK